LTEFSLYISVLKVTGDACPTMLLNILWAMSPKDVEFPVDCAQTEDFHLQLSCSPLGWQRDHCHQYPDIWRKAFNLSVFARKPSATCRPMLYGTGVSGYSLSLRRSTFSVWVCDIARSWKATFPFACIRLSFFADVVSFTDLPIEANKNSVYQMSKIK